MGVIFVVEDLPKNTDDLHKLLEMAYSEGIEDGRNDRDSRNNANVSNPQVSFVKFTSYLDGF